MGADMANGNNADSSGDQGDAADGAPPPARPRVGNALTVAPSDDAEELSHGVQVPKHFQLVCYCTFNSETAVKYYLTFGAMIAVTARLREHLDAINAASPRKFTYDIPWVLPGSTLADLGPPALQPWDAIVYFRLTNDNRNSLALRIHPEAPMPDPNRQGLTAGNTQTVAEVYLQGGFPAELLGNLVFHEFMHLKLDVGQTVVNDIHELNKHTPLNGISTKPTEEWYRLTPPELKQLVAHLFDPVDVYRG